VVANREEPDILYGATLHVDYATDDFGGGFYVRRGRRAASCC
jgi:hypothetical protein